MQNTAKPEADGRAARSRRAPERAFRLLLYFSITAGVAILLVAVAISWIYYGKEIREQIEATEARNVALANTVANSIWPQFEAHLTRSVRDAKQMQDDPNTQKLRDALTAIVRQVQVTKIKIYNTAGRAVYSSELDEIGEDKNANPLFRAALGGKTASELTRRGEMSASENEIEDFDVVASYIPINGDKGKRLAVFELYSDVTDTMAYIQRTTLRLLFGLISIFATLYAVLILIVGAADRILRSQFEEIKANQAQIQSKNLELEEEIEARRKVEAALRSSEEAAGSANRAKSEFLSNMSHELRTPMNAILGFGQLLTSEPDAPLGDNQRRFVDEILKAGRHLLALINEVLDLAQIEAGKVALSVEPVPLANVLRDSLPLIQNMARDSEVQVRSPAPVTIHVMADYMRLKQVVLNLLSNAVKYNRRGGEVSIGVAKVPGNRARISVTDSGFGIPEEKQGELFLPFHRLGNPLVVEGTGIGLALTRNLVLAMGGKIGFHSVAGTGTTFWVEFPVATDSPTQADAADSRQGGTGAGDGAKGTVLYIEDNPANVLLIEEIAGRMSIGFLSAHNAELGLVLAAAQKPDLIIMDINLPQMDGYEALARLKLDPATASIPVIALSANAMEKDIARGLAAGFARYHTKPIDVDEITASVTKILGSPK